MTAPGGFKLSQVVGAKGADECIRCGGQDCVRVLGRLVGDLGAGPQ